MQIELRSICSGARRAPGKDPAPPDLCSGGPPARREQSQRRESASGSAQNRGRFAASILLFVWARSALPAERARFAPKQRSSRRRGLFGPFGAAEHRRRAERLSACAEHRLRRCEQGFASQSLASIRRRRMHEHMRAAERQPACASRALAPKGAKALPSQARAPHRGGPSLLGAQLVSGLRPLTNCASRGRAPKGALPLHGEQASPVPLLISRAAKPPGVAQLRRAEPALIVLQRSCEAAALN